MEKNKIYLGNCIELMKKLDTDSVDLIIADPPYNLRKDFGNESDKWEKVEDWINWSKEWIKECHRVLKPTGAIFIYGIHKYLCFIQCYLYEIGMNYGRQFIWHYENNWSQYSKYPASNYEPLLWFTKTKEYTYHLIREPYKSQDRIKHKIIKNGKVWKPNPQGKHSGDVWKFPILAGKLFEQERVKHPTQKPLSITNKIIKHFSNEGDLILVPFVGSGTECLSSKINNRNFIGFEINKDYIKIANKRLKEN